MPDRTANPLAPLPRFLVMAKPPVPGQVKTRLTPTLTPNQAAAVHAAMFAALVARLDRFVQAGQAKITLALAVPDLPDTALKRSALLRDAFADHPAARDTLLDIHLDIVAQGPGDLGQRIRNAWPDRQPAVVLGMDSPDLPEAHLQAAFTVASPIAPGCGPADHQPPDAAIGPTDDGGYWTLAAPRPPLPLLTKIDWGTSAVYDQSHENARAADFTLVDLPPWHDVDTPDDLDALRRRLQTTDDPALQQLADQLQAITA
ncbi:MAG: DUF2064 domain-containing protein [Planctomycetota bacterium]